MGEKTVFHERVGSIDERFIYDDAERQVTVHRTEDAQSVIDAVAKANLHGTAEVEGLGRLVAEVPLTLAMEWCQRRGIPWERFMYSNDYDAEFKRFIAAHQRIQYDKPAHKRRVN